MHIQQGAKLFNKCVKLQFNTTSTTTFHVSVTVLSYLNLRMHTKRRLPQPVIKLRSQMSRE